MSIEALEDLKNIRPTELLDLNDGIFTQLPKFAPIWVNNITRLNADNFNNKMYSSIRDYINKLAEKSYTPVREQLYTHDSSIHQIIALNAGWKTTLDKEDPLYTAEIFNDYVNNKATNPFSHAEGCITSATGLSSHAEGQNTTASGDRGHAEGLNTLAGGIQSHAEGHFSQAIGNVSHAEGSDTIASGECSHTEGRESKATMLSSHAEGIGTIASLNYQHVEGQYNVENSGADADRYVHIIGNGTSDTERSNCHTVTREGQAWYAKDVYVGSTSGKNKDSGSKKLATEEYVGITEVNSFNITPTSKSGIYRATSTFNIQVDGATVDGFTIEEHSLFFVKKQTTGEYGVLRLEAFGLDYSNVEEMYAIVYHWAPNGISNYEIVKNLTNLDVTDDYIPGSINPVSGIAVSKAIKTLGSVLRYKGSVNTKDDLPSTKQTVGDTYNILTGEYAGANFAWTGTEWDKLSETVDLSEIDKRCRSLVFDTKADVTSFLAGTYTRDDGITKEDLKPGDLFLIEELSTADMYWTGNEAKEIEAYSSGGSSGDVTAITTSEIDAICNS